MHKPAGLTRAEMANEEGTRLADSPRAAPRYVGSVTGECDHWRALAEHRLALMQARDRRIAELERDRASLVAMLRRQNSAMLKDAQASASSAEATP